MRTAIVLSGKHARFIILDFLESLYICRVHLWEEKYESYV